MTLKLKYFLPLDFNFLCYSQLDTKAKITFGARIDSLNLQIL